MVATFGGLNGATLRLEPGLNVISAPNEWGKSTWCAFFTAMLYGVETGQRTTKDTLADKEKYAPWSGQPMEGILRIEHEGKDITIQRRSKGRTPLGDFQAFETRTGVAVPWLTAENCGQKLLGVEKSVFQRTGFIRFSDLAVVPDEALWRRLHNLVTTGDETGDEDLRSRLKELKHKCRSPRGGRVPETEQQIAGLQQQLQDRQALEKRQQQLLSQTNSAQAELEALRRHQAVCTYRDAEQLREQTQIAMQTAMDARDAVEELEQKCRDLPETEELLAKQREAQELLGRLRNLQEETPPSVMGVVWMCILAALALVAAVFCLLRQEDVWAMGAAGVLVLGLLLAGILADRRRKITRNQLQEQKKREKLIHDLMEATQTLQGRLSLRQELEQACRTAEQTRLHLQSLTVMTRQVMEAEEADDLDLTLEETEQRIAQVTERLRLNQLRLGQCQGRMETMTEAEQLQRDLKLQQTRLTELLRYERALDLALGAMEEATRELQRRFSPRITALAQDFLSRLTHGRYNRVTIGEDLSILASSETETTLRGCQWRSDGTADLMYLALRLAVWVILNPHGPLILDDALVRLDDKRLTAVLALLSELGLERQVILFSCQDREKRMIG
jgi:uncharacterized protein YhaN